MTNGKIPVHLQHPFAVYELTDGVFTVTRNGEWWGHPFETTDAELARIVCGRWAAEFAPARPTTQPPARRERPLLFWSAFFAVWVGAQMAALLAITGEPGGTGHDPLWVGPVCAAAGMVVACAVAVLWIFCEVLAERRAERIQGAAGPEPA